MLRFIKLTFLLLFIALFMAFAVANRASVTLSLSPLPYVAEMPLFLFALLVFAMGACAGSLIIAVKMAKMKRVLVHSLKRTDALEHELGALRSERETKLPAVK